MVGRHIGKPLLPVDRVRGLYRLGHAPAAGSLRHVMARMPMPAYFLFPFETMWTDARKGTLSAGDLAPDLTVKTLDTKVPTQLASLWADKPVVLVLGAIPDRPFGGRFPP